MTEFGIVPRLEFRVYAATDRLKAELRTNPGHRPAISPISRRKGNCHDECCRPRLQCRHNGWMQLDAVRELRAPTDERRLAGQAHGRLAGRHWGFAAGL